MWKRLNDYAVFVLCIGGSLLRAWIPGALERDYTLVPLSLGAVLISIFTACGIVAIWEYLGPWLRKRLNHKGRRANWRVRFFFAPVLGWVSAEGIQLAWAVFQGWVNQ